MSHTTISVLWLSFQISGEISNQRNSKCFLGVCLGAQFSRTKIAKSSGLIQCSFGGKNAIASVLFVAENAVYAFCLVNDKHA